MRCVISRSPSVIFADSRSRRRSLLSALQTFPRTAVNNPLRRGTFDVVRDISPHCGKITIYAKEAFGTVLLKILRTVRRSRGNTAARSVPRTNRKTNSLRLRG